MNEVESAFITLMYGQTVTNIVYMTGCSIVRAREILAIYNKYMRVEI